MSRTVFHTHGFLNNHISFWFQFAFLQYTYWSFKYFFEEILVQFFFIFASLRLINIFINSYKFYLLYTCVLQNVLPFFNWTFHPFIGMF